MYLINTILKPNRYWGIYWCKVFMTSLEWIKDVTEDFNNIFEYDSKEQVLKISFWSWTWFNRIKQHISETYWDEILFYNVSI